MASAKSVGVDNVLAEKLKNARIRLGLTQEDVANKANVSRLKYHRIEACKVDYVDESLLYKIAEILNIDYLSLTRNNIYKSTFLYTNDMRLDLLNLKNVKGFSSISETIKYCIDYTINEIGKSNVSTEIMNNVREAIVNTFVQEMDKLSHAHDMDTFILKYLDDKYGTNSNELRTDIEQYLTKIKHSKNY